MQNETKEIFGTPKRTDETPEQTKARQTREYNKMIKELQVDIAQMWTRKVQKDAYYINFSNIVEQCI